MTSQETVVWKMALFIFGNRETLRKLSDFNGYVERPFTNKTAYAKINTTYRFCDFKQKNGKEPESCVILGELLYRP